MSIGRKRVPPPLPAESPEPPKPFTIRVLKNGQERLLELDGKHAEAISEVWPGVYLGMIAAVRIRELPK